MPVQSAYLISGRCLCACCIVAVCEPVTGWFSAQVRPPCAPTQPISVQAVQGADAPGHFPYLHCRSQADRSHAPTVMLTATFLRPFACPYSDADCHFPNLIGGPRSGVEGTREQGGEAASSGCSTGGAGQEHNTTYLIQPARLCRLSRISADGVAETIADRPLTEPQWLLLLYGAGGPTVIQLASQRAEGGEGTGRAGTTSTAGLSAVNRP